MACLYYKKRFQIECIGAPVRFKQMKPKGFNIRKNQLKRCSEDK